MMSMYGFQGTVVGVRCGSGVVLASDTRATAAYLVMSKRARKVFKIQDRIGAAISGVSGDVQNLVSVLQAESNLYRLQEGRDMSSKSMAQLASNILHSKRASPYIVSAIIGGVDDDGAHLYFLDPAGGKLEEEKFAAGGTGETVAYGVLEQSYRDGLSLKECAKLAAQSIKRAIERDAATGDDTIVAMIDKDGYRELSKKEIEELLK